MESLFGKKFIKPKQCYRKESVNLFCKILISIRYVIFQFGAVNLIILFHQLMNEMEICGGREENFASLIIIGAEI